MAYRVTYIDNCAPPGHDACWQGMSFDTLEAAVACCKLLVDEFLTGYRKATMTAADLWWYYATFGEAQRVVSTGDAKEHFGGWSYARERCEALCEGRIRDQAPGVGPRDAGYVICVDWANTWGWT